MKIGPWEFEQVPGDEPPAAAAETVPVAPLRTPRPKRRKRRKNHGKPGRLHRSTRGQVFEAIRVREKQALTVQAPAGMVWLLAWRCERCGYSWLGRLQKNTSAKKRHLRIEERTCVPPVCPKCKATDWARPKAAWEKSETKAEARKRREAKAVAEGELAGILKKTAETESVDSIPAEAPAPGVRLGVVDGVERREA